MLAFCATRELSHFTDCFETEYYAWGVAVNAIATRCVHLRLPLIEAKVNAHENSAVRVEKRYTLRQAAPPTGLWYLLLGP